MSKTGMRLTPAELERFVMGRETFAFDPATRALVATITYNMDGTCRAQFETGDTDNGQWGIENDTYWTRYNSFRGGTRNVFFLTWVAEDTAQAYFADGTIAFVQSGVREVREIHDT